MTSAARLTTVPPGKARARVAPVWIAHGPRAGLRAVRAHTVRRRASAVALVAIGYYVGGLLGLAVRMPPAGISIMWPPNAILLAALLLSPMRLWPLYLLVLLPTHLQLVAEFQPGVPAVTMIAQYLGNVVQALLAAVGLRWVREAPPRFDTLRGTVLFILIAAIGAVLLATSGVVYLFELTGWVTDYWLAWRQRLLNNVVTTLTVTPVIVLALTSGVSLLRRLPPHRAIELCVLVVATFALVAIFDSREYARELSGILLFAPLPPLLWAAVRFPPLCLFACLQVAMLALLINAYSGRGPFLTLPPGESVLALQTFLIAIAVPTILLMALTQERERTRRALLENQRRYDMATTAGAIGVWDWDLRTGEFFLEPSLKARLGYADHEIRNTLEGWMEHLHPDDDGVVWGRVHDYLAGRIRAFETEHRVLDRDGGVRWLLCRGAATEWEDGVIIRMVGTSSDITERKRAEQELRWSSERIRELAGRLISAQEDERRRIARDLHDDLNQKIAALAIGLSNVRRTLPASAQAQHAEIELLQARTSDLVCGVRALSHELHPAVLDHAGIVPALIDLAREMRRLEAFELELVVPHAQRTVPREVATALYRIAQESVRNALRHSGVGWARLILKVDDDRVTLIVRDSGRGFDAERARDGTGLGLVSIRERVNLLRGRIDVSSTVGKGTVLTVVVPLPAEPVSSDESDDRSVRAG